MVPTPTTEEASWDYELAASLFHVCDIFIIFIIGPPSPLLLSPHYTDFLGNKGEGLNHVGGRKECDRGMSVGTEGHLNLDSL